MPSVSHSRADGYLLCRRKDYYGYTLGLQRVTESDSLAFGSAVHAVLEAFYNAIREFGGDSKVKQRRAFGKAALVAIDKVKELYREGFVDHDRVMPLREAIDWYLELEPFVKNGWRIMAVEKEFLLEYNPETQERFRLVIDLIVEDPKGYYVIVDHKTTGQFYNPNTVGIQGQIPKYIAALRGLGYKISYGIYNQIRSTRIRGEKLTKKGLVDLLISHYGQDSPPEEMKAWEEDLPKLTVAKLEAMAKDQKLNIYAGPTAEQVHQTLDVRASNTRVVRTFEEQMGVAAEISARELLPVEVIEKSAYRTANKMVCQSCSFLEICEAELDGRSTKMLLQTEYKVREKRPEIEVSEEVE